MNAAFSVTKSSWDVPVAATAGAQVIGQVGQPSPILHVLSPTRQAAFEVAPAPGQVLYLNPYAARQQGLPVPPGHHVTPEYAAEILGRYCVRSIVPRVDETEFDPATKLRKASPGEDPNSVVDSPEHYGFRAVNLAPNGAASVMYADRYAQSEGHEGNARGGITQDGNICIKGVGITPLYKKANADHRHSGGWENTRWSIIDTVRLELSANLFTRHGIWPIAIFGLSAFVPIGDWYTDGFKHLGMDQVGILLRGGAHYRNGNFIEPSYYGPWVPTIIARIQEAQGMPEADRAANARAREAVAGATIKGKTVEFGTIDPSMFMRAARTMDLLAFHEIAGAVEPDLAQTLAGLIDLVAQHCAEQWRWGEAHGTPSFGNLQIDGANLDPTTNSAMPRRGPMQTNPATAPFGIDPGYEFFMLEEAIRAIYETLKGNLTEAQRVQFHLPEMEIKALFYERLKQIHLPIQMLRATGLKQEVVDRLWEEHHDLAKELGQVMFDLSHMENPGGPVRVYARYSDYPANAEQAATEKSVVDLFGALGPFADRYFFHQDDDHLRDFVQLLQPIFKGDVAAQREELLQLARRFLELYARVMRLVEEQYVGFYDGKREMQTAIATRAQFENRHGLYVWSLKPALRALAVQADETGQGPLTDSLRVTRFIRDIVAAYSRNTHALLRQGDLYRYESGVVELGVKTYDWVTTGVRVPSRGQIGRRVLFLRVPLNDEGEGYVTPDLFGRRYTQVELSRAQFHYQLAEGGETETAEVVITHIGDQRYAEFAIEVAPSQAGVLSGEIRMAAPGWDSAFDEVIAPYAHAFAVPDGKDLAVLIDEHERGIGW